MKKFVSLCLLIALVCSLCATGVSAAALSPEELYEKYATIIDALEAEDYSTAYKEVRDMIPLEAFEAVEITKDNFFDYYEIVKDEPTIERDSSGKIKSVTPGNFLISLKEEYWDRLYGDRSSIKVRVKADKSFARAKIDWETGEITVSSKTDSDVKKALKKLEWVETKLDSSLDSVFSWWSVGWNTFYYKDSQYKYWTTGEAKPGLDVKYYQAVYSNVEVSEVSGTLYLAPEA